MIKGIDLDLLNEYEKMIPSVSTKLEYKAELIKLQDSLNRRINELDHMIEIYSTLDFIRVGELMGERITLNNQLLDVLTYSNDLYLASIRDAV